MNFMDARALIETGVISILFVFHVALQAYLCYTGTYMEMSTLKKINRNVSYFFKRGTNLL